MNTTEQPKLVLHFHGEEAKFQSKAYRNRIARVVAAADRLLERAMVDRDRLHLRAQH